MAGALRRRRSPPETLPLEGTYTDNLTDPARVLSDGEHIALPTKAEVETALAQGSAGGTVGAAASSLVNINTADASALETLSGVGSATAQAIISDREQNGPFSTIEDLMRVDGIGEKKFAKLKDSICV